MRDPYVVRDGATYKTWYVGFDGTSTRLMYATSADGIVWTRQGVVLDVQMPPYNFDSIGRASVMKDGAVYKLWFSGGWWGGSRIGGPWSQAYYAESPDGISWTIVGLALGIGNVGAWDGISVHSPEVVQDGSGRYWLYYQGWDGTAGGWNQRIGLATSTEGRTFTRVGVDPTLALGPPGAWDSRSHYWVSVIPGSPWQLWYTGSDGATARIGRAVAPDPYNWTKSNGNPEFVEGPPGSWDDAAVQSPRILSDGGEWYMYYTGSDGPTLRIGRARLTQSYASTGTFLSQALDSGGAGTVWGTLSANATVPAGTGVVLSTRSGDYPVPDGLWSGWSVPVPPGVSSITSPRARYLQVRVDFSTSNSSISPVLHDFSVDYEPNRATAPVPLSPMGDEWRNTSGLRLEWMYTDPESDAQAGFHVQISSRSDFTVIEVDSSIVLSPGASWLTPPLADDRWYWRVRTMDTFTMWSAYSAPESVRIDTRPPTTVLGFAAPADLVNGIPRVASSNRVVLTAFDPGSGVSQMEYRVDLGPPTAYTSPFLPAAHGYVRVDYRSVDAAVNSESWNVMTLLVDDTPSVVPVSPADGEWLNRSLVTVGWAYADPEGDQPAMYEAELSGDPSFATVAFSSGIVSGGSSSHGFPGLDDRLYYWRVRAADEFGVWSTFGPARSFLLDTRPPAVSHSWSETLGAIDGRTWIAPGTFLTLSVNDAGAGVDAVYLSIDGVVTDYVAPLAITAHGPHTIDYWASDNAGNAGPVTRLEILVDRAPTVGNRNPKDGGWSAPSLWLTWTFTDPDGDAVDAYEIQMSSDAAFSPVSIVASGLGVPPATEWPAPVLAEGVYFWRVRARDAVGVWSPWSSPTTVRVDATPPETAVLRGGAPVTSPRIVVVEGEGLALDATDAGSGVALVEYALDGGSWTDYAGPLPLAPGRHVLAFRGIDNVGNEEAPRVLVVDVVYPMNWTPVIAAILGLVLALCGAWVANRARRGHPRSAKALAWTVLSGPALAVEVVVAAYSLLTGALATPPWTGEAIVVTSAVAIAGLVMIGIGGTILSPRTTAKT